VSGGTRRAGSGIAVVLAFALGGELASGASAATLPPDLVARPLAAIKLCQESPDVLFKNDACTGTGSVVLRISTEVANRGPGPLEFAPDESAEPNDCNGNGDPTDDVLVYQRIFRDRNRDGIFERDTDTGFSKHLAGCRYYHAVHDHYHLDGYARFLLKRQSTGRTVARGRKISFCIIDSSPFDSSLPGAPESAYYMETQCESKDGITGTSVGWYDQYVWRLYGQSLDVTGLPKGRYCLIEKVDPRNQIVERRDDNNVREALVWINPANAPASPQPPASVRVQQSPC